MNVRSRNQTRQLLLTKWREQLSAETLFGGNNSSCVRDISMLPSAFFCKFNVVIFVEKVLKFYKYLNCDKQWCIPVSGEHNRSCCWSLQRWWLVEYVALHVGGENMHNWLHSRVYPLKGGCQVWRRVAWREQPEWQASGFDHGNIWEKVRTLPSTAEIRIRFVGIEG